MRENLVSSRRPERDSRRSIGLQRDPDFTGDRITDFGSVFFRHGLPGLCLAIILLFHPALQTAFVESLTDGRTTPALYLMGFLVILFGTLVYQWRSVRGLKLGLIGWSLYLAALSFWEEWIFRLAIPTALESFGASFRFASIVSAVLFGALHYFTLRWRWQWCLGAAVGGLALSRQMVHHNDLLLIAAVHWIATFINTPFPPLQKDRSAYDAMGKTGGKK